MIAPGHLLSDTAAVVPLVRVVCRYPFDAPTAGRRWIVEHINQPTHAVEIVREAELIGRDLLVTMPLQVSLYGPEQR